MCDDARGEVYQRSYDIGASGYYIIIRNTLFGIKPLFDIGWPWVYLHN